MKQNLLDFINSEKQILKFPEKGSRFNTNLIKVQSEQPEIIYLYYVQFQKEYLNPHNDNIFFGIYCKNNNRLICDDWVYYVLNNEVESLDLSGITIEGISKTEVKATKQIREIIKKLLPFETDTSTAETQTLHSYMKERAKKEAYYHYITSEQVNKNYYTELYMSHFKYEDFPVFIDYLLDDEESLKKVAEKFIADNKEYLLNRIAYTKIVERELQRLNETDEYIDRKRIINVVNQDMKTIQVTILKDNKEFSFKIENCLSPGTEEISRFRIVSASDRSTFQSLYGNYADFSIDDIIEIRYGRKTLYKRDKKAA